jgi:hypothetical protein
VGEAFGLGQCSPHELAEVRVGAQAARDDAMAREREAEACVDNAFDAVAWQDAEMLAHAATTVCGLTEPAIFAVAPSVVEEATEAAAIDSLDTYEDWETAKQAEMRAVCELLCDMIGNPFGSG